MLTSCGPPIKRCSASNWMEARNSIEALRCSQSSCHHFKAWRRRATSSALARLLKAEMRK